MLPLAKAVENVNFPLRLDKIDLAVATQASTLSAFQNSTERRITELVKAGEDANEAVEAIKGLLARAGKQRLMQGIVLTINTAVLLALAAYLVTLK